MSASIPPGVPRLLALCLVMALPAQALAARYSLQSDVRARTGVNDNIFMSSQSVDTVTWQSLRPSLALVAEDINWTTSVDGMVAVNRYSDNNLDSDDVYFDLVSQYTLERHAIEGRIGWDRDSNLRSDSDAFGITGQRIDRSRLVAGADYRYSLTERASVSAGINHTEVEYPDDSAATYVPYALDSLSSGLFYLYSPRTTLSLSASYSEYESDDGAISYQTGILQVGITEQFTERLTVSLSAGTNRRDILNRSSSSFVLFGQTITQIQEVEFQDDGLELGASANWQFEEAKLSANLGRSTTANSFGGLNEVDSLRLDYNLNADDHWRYKLQLRYQDINSVSTVARITDRDLLIARLVLSYRVDSHWSVVGSYRFSSRTFADPGVTDEADSNSVFVELVYKLPDISTN